jgi:hypothetical protein
MDPVKINTVQREDKKQVHGPSTTKAPADKQSIDKE